MTLHAPPSSRATVNFILRKTLLSRTAGAAIVSLAALGGAYQGFAAQGSLKDIETAAATPSRLAAFAEAAQTKAAQERPQTPAPRRVEGSLFQFASLDAAPSAFDSDAVSPRAMIGAPTLEAAGSGAPEAIAPPPGVTTLASLDPSESAPIEVSPRVTPTGFAPATMMDEGLALTEGAQEAPRAVTPMTGASFAPMTAMADADSAPGPVKKEIRARDGETLLSVLLANGVSDAEAAVAVKSIFQGKPRRLHDGDRIELTFVPGDETGSTLQTLRLFDREALTTSLRWNSAATNFWEEPAAFAAVEDPEEPPAETAAPTEVAKAPPPPPQKPAEPRPARKEVVVSVAVEDSLYETAAAAGLNKSQIADIIKIFRYTIDFERDIHAGDRLEAVFERRLKDGAYVDGPLQFAALETRGKRRAFFRLELDDGKFGYFDETGRTYKRSYIRTPISGARITSKFGSRRHPILGYNKMHRGIDFAAPTGTPIIAANDGVITFKGWKSGYGQYVQIKHNNQFSTAYAHMSRFAKSLNVGDQVAQGEVIGYVGTTGRSTGPHLHFEVVKDGTRVDPLTLRDFAGNKLDGKELAELKRLVKTMDGKIKAVNREHNLVADAQ